MAKKSTAYSEKLKDPRWQRIRLAVFERDEFACSCCGDAESTLFVHHGYYIFGKEPWEYPLESLHTACEDCHHGADQTREEFKVFVGTLGIDAQWTALDGLMSLLRMGYSEFMCGLSAMKDPEIVRASIDAWMAKGKAKRQQDAEGQ